METIFILWHYSLVGIVSPLKKLKKEVRYTCSENNRERKKFIVATFVADKLLILSPEVECRGRNQNSIATTEGENLQLKARSGSEMIHSQQRRQGGLNKIQLKMAS